MAYIDPGRQGEQKEYTLGFGVGSTWHTPVDCSSKILQFCEAVNLPITGGQRIPDPGIGRLFGMYNPSIGKIECKGDVAFTAATYGQIDYWFAACMGEDTKTGPTDTTAYLHTLSVAPSLWGNFLCLAYNFRGYDCVEFPSVKVHGFELTANPGEVAKVKFNCLADYACTDIDDERAGSVVATDAWTPTVSPVWVTNSLVGLYVVVVASGTAGEIGKSFPITANTATAATATGMTAGAPGATSAVIGPLNSNRGAGGTFYTTAAEDFGDRLHFDDLVVRIGAPGTSALDATCSHADDFNVGQIKVTFERPMTGDFRSPSTCANVLSKHSIWQARDTGICKLEVEFQFPNYDKQVHDMFKRWVSAYPQSRRLELIFTSGLMAGATTTAYKWHLKIPAAFMSGNPMNLPLSGGVPATIKFEATYYTGDYMPTLEITNKNSADLITAPTTW